jgi:hypothetical protein
MCSFKKKFQKPKFFKFDSDFELTIRANRFDKLIQIGDEGGGEGRGRGGGGGRVVWIIAIVGRTIETHD